MFLSIVKNNTRTVVVDVARSKLADVILKETWSTSLFKENYRNIDNFISTELLALDVDDGLTVDEAKKRLIDYNVIIATTRNHNLEKNGKVAERFRILFVLERPIDNKAVYAETWKKAFELVPEADPVAKDCARQFFASKEVVFDSHGKLFPVAEMPVVEVIQTQKLPAMKYPVPKYVKDFMENGSESWNVTLFKVSKMMQEAGYEYEDTVDLLNTMSNAQFSGVLDEADLKTIRSAFAKPGKYEPKVGWPDVLKTKSGELIPDPASHNNFIYLVTDILKMDIKLNELRNRVEVNGEVLSDLTHSKLLLQSRDFGLKPSDNFITACLTVIAAQNKYHPFKQMVESIPWDGIDRIEQLYKTIKIEGDELPQYREYVRRWFIGVIARVYGKGAQNNVLTFLGKQAAGKSRWFEKLAAVPGMYSEAVINPENKDDLIKSTQNVIIHLAELDAITKKRDSALLKSYLTATAVDVRAPYDKYSQTLTPIASFVASVNEPKFLFDTTGSRRYLVIPVESLLVDHEIDMQQVYAQALWLYNNGEKFYFEQDEIVDINESNEAYNAENKLDYLVVDLKPGEFRINGNELLDKLGYKDNRTNFDYVLLGKALKDIGIQAKRVGKKKLTYYLIDETSLPKLGE